MKKQGAGLAACPLKKPVDHYLHLENSSSRPSSDAFQAGLIGVLHVADKWVLAAIGHSDQKLFSCSCLDLDCDLESSNQLNMLFHLNKYSVLYLIHGETDTNGISSLVKTDFSKRCVDKFGSQCLFHRTVLC